MRPVEIIFWRGNQKLVIDKKWEDPERQVGFLCETLNKQTNKQKWDRVEDVVINIVHVDIEMPIRHLWKNVGWPKVRRTGKSP